MVFSSLLFLIIFLPLTLILYYLIPKCCKNVFLLIVSLLFYSWGEPSHVILMVITTLYIYIFGLLTEKFKSKGNIKLARLFMILSLVFSLGTLAFYKYFGFITDNIPFLKSSFISSIKPSLPIGISFYTFQALSYVIDVYRGNVKAQKNWINFAMYISLFPQLIAGPIVRYSDIESQLTNRQYSFQNISKGISRFCLGMGKKVLLANQIGIVYEQLSASYNSVLGAWLSAIAFTFQIYFDFSAYSDMAIGLGKMFGFEFPENFNYPYKSKSITEFWHRWHITLGTWFKEYLYIPLGGNRKGTPRLILNLFIVWSLTGLWHGADWQFILWGIYYFVFLVIEKLFLLKCFEKYPNFLKHLYSIFVIVLGWVIFSSKDIYTAFSAYKAMFGIGVPFIDSSSLFLLTSNFLLLIVLFIGSTDLPKCMISKIKNHIAVPAIVDYASIIILWVSMAFLMNDSYNPFLYFRF